ncbi:MAG TPA: HU family DNA-binding protein, partial [Ignavibacteriaceae bacterium]
MTKAELILKIAKNVGVPAADAKIFFELLLKRISTSISIGQSINLNDFGYFHLIKGNIKKRAYGFRDNEISEEIIELILFSENKELRKSETKGLVFNIPLFDEEDFHPIDSTFSLSIGKPLIPLRGVPFDNIYVPTSGYEYRRLIESKVEKIIASSEIAESEENFPTLVIDASSYDSNQVKLNWDDSAELEKDIFNVEPTAAVDEHHSVFSDSDKQRNELKNIAWDFGEDLSRQIEAESILDIADERLNMNLKLSEGNKNLEKDPDDDTIKSEIHDFIKETNQDASSEKLNEL